MPDPVARLERLGRLGVWEWDLTSGTARWSDEALAIARVLGRRRPAAAGQFPFTVHPDDAAAAERFVAALTTWGRAAEAELRVLAGDGAALRLRLAAEPVPMPVTMPVTVPVPVAVTSGGRATGVFGVVQDITELRRTETALDIAQVQLAAQRTRFDVEHQVADLLRRIVIPDEPPALPEPAGIEVGAHYRPASTATGVGGDWYGAFPMPSRRTLLTVGDVAGHGLPAASAMALLSNALRGLALTGAGPGELLVLLNTLVCGIPAFTIASAWCAVYDPDGRTLSYANAGHPEPLLLRGGSAAVLEGPHGPVLGAVGGEAYQEASAVLRPGDVLAVFTDGLVERRKNRRLDEAALVRWIGDPDADLQGFVERVFAASRSDTDDDSCLLAVRVR